MKLKKYAVCHGGSGQHLGYYWAESPTAAKMAMARDAGYFLDNFTPDMLDPELTAFEALDQTGGEQ